MTNTKVLAGIRLSQQADAIKSNIDTFTIMFNEWRHEGGNIIFRHHNEIASFFDDLQRNYGIRIELTGNFTNFSQDQIFNELARIEDGLESDNPNSLLDSLILEVQPDSRVGLIREFIAESLRRGVAPEALTAEISSMCHKVYMNEFALNDYPNSASD